MIELDDELLASARAELGTAGFSDTVRSALRHAVASSARARQVQWLVDGGLESLIDKTVRDVVWR